MHGIALDDYRWYIDHALDAMMAIVVDLGDDANVQPDLPGANSPYVILTHCLGVMAYWGGRMIAGRPIVRDRPAEFTASGTVAELARRVAIARSNLDADIANVDPTAAPAHPPDPEDTDLPLGRTQGGVLLHIYEELSQHLGQMELTRDIIRATRRDGPQASP
ncbi:hypothetical protein BH23ACT10_BH23ACT10_06430 [soil metagenome]